MPDSALTPEDAQLLRDAAYILANNGLEGDVSAEELSRRLHGLLAGTPRTEFNWMEFLVDRRAAWVGFLEVDEDDALANDEVDAIDQAIEAVSPGWLQKSAPAR